MVSFTIQPGHGDMKEMAKPEWSLGTFHVGGPVPKTRL